MAVTSTVSTSASNLTKFYAGGSGDNVIADGYIKTVEKVWIDSYTIAFTNTLTTIQIAELPENKKITSIVVDILTTASQTSGTISIGYVMDTTDILAAGGCVNFMGATTLTHNLTKTSISLPGGSTEGGTSTSGTTTFVMKSGGFQSVTGGTQTTIGIKLNNWTMTSGTIKTIIRYT
jgi:hypothetical protein